MIKKYSDQMNVTELMNVKGGRYDLNVCLGKGATAVIRCDVAGAGVIVQQPTEPEKPQKME